MMTSQWSLDRYRKRRLAQAEDDVDSRPVVAATTTLSGSTVAEACVEGDREIFSIKRVYRKMTKKGEDLEK